MDKKFLVTGAILAGLAVVIGAFATHGLKALLNSASINAFETGVKYQMYHALVFLIIGSISVSRLKFRAAIFYLLLFGVIFFSGSIYVLSTDTLLTWDASNIALLTPLGGILLITAWVLIVISFFKISGK